MTRALTSGMLTAIAADTGIEVHLVEMNFSSGVLRVTDAPADVSWNGHTWLGIGGLVSVSGTNEAGDLSSWGTDLALAGVDQTVLALILGAQYIGRAITVWSARWDATAGTVIADPFVKFGGYMNGSWTIEENRPFDGNGGTVTARTRCTDRLSGLDQRRGIQPNMAAHWYYYPGDRFFQMVGQVAYTPILWKR